jgi:hypothetical protein
MDFAVDKIENGIYPNALLFSNFETYQIPLGGGS